MFNTLKKISNYIKPSKELGNYVDKIYSLRQNSNYLRVSHDKLLELSPLGIIVLDLDGVIIECNPAAYKVPGYTQEDLIGKHFSEIVAVQTDEISVYDKLFRSLKNGESIKPFEWSYKRKDGTSGYSEIYVSLLEDKGEKLGILIMQKDITTQKEWENSIKESEKKYRELLDNTNDLIQSVTPNGRFRYVNNTWRKILGYIDTEIADLTIFDIIHPDYVQNYRQLFNKLLAGEKIGHIETAFVSKIGDVLIVEGNINVRFEDGKPIYTRGIFRDITKDKNLEEQIIRLNNALSLSTDCIFITDLNAKIIDVNEKALEICGVDKKEDLIGIHFLGLIVQAERAQASMDVKDIVEKGYLKGQEYHIISKQGETTPVRMTSSIIMDADDNPIGLVRVGRPRFKKNSIKITEKKV